MTSAAQRRLPIVFLPRVGSDENIRSITSIQHILHTAGEIGNPFRQRLSSTIDRAHRICTDQRTVRSGEEETGEPCEACQAASARSGTQMPTRDSPGAHMTARADPLGPARALCRLA